MAPPSSRPLIAVVGSLDSERRDYLPAVKNLEVGEQACAALGRALARAGCDLLVFSSRRKYVERQVVRGYAAESLAANPGNVIVRPPGHASVSFDLPENSNTRVTVQPDTSGEWELSYYRSILDSDGLILVGGGRSTRIAGIFALTQTIPVLPIAAFGGGASQVRVNLDKVHNDATPEEIRIMGQPWSDEIAPTLIEGLLDQRKRKDLRDATESRAKTSRTRAGRIALTLTLLGLITSWLAPPFVGSTTPPSALALATLLSIPMVAAASGALLRNSKNQEQWGWSAARGLGAGFVTVFLYVAGELISVPDLLQHIDTQRLLFFLAPLGFVAGFTFDKVLERILSGETKVPTLRPRADKG